MPGKPTFTMAAMRTDARALAERTSIRTAAAEIGMSYSGFRAFLAGGKPHPSTREKLIAWYLAERGKPAKSREEIRLTSVDAELAAQIVASYISDDEREGARDRRFFEIVQSVAEKSRVSADLRAKIRGLGSA